jgi:hypothetical protein
MALAVCVLGACSGTTGSSGSVPDPNPVQDPAGNPEQALLNGQVPLSNPEQPPTNSEAAPPNPQQPSAPRGSSAATGGGAMCNQFCVNVGTTCATACANFCGQIVSVAAPCVAAASRFVSCIIGVQITCTADGVLHFRNRDDCQNESDAVQACADSATMAVDNRRGNVTTLPPPPGNSDGN